MKYFYGQDLFNADKYLINEWVIKIDIIILIALFIFFILYLKSFVWAPENWRKFYQ